MDKKQKKRIQTLQQRLQELRPKLAGAKRQMDDPQEVKDLQQQIAVRVAGQALRVIDQEAANVQRHALFEDVRVVAKSDACFHGLFILTYLQKIDATLQLY